MPLCTYAPDNRDGLTTVDNAFIRHFLPYAPEAAVKVYLYGLYLCADPLSQDNNLAGIAQGLDLTQEEVRKAFEYWQEQGIVRVVQSEPYAVQYLSPSRAFAPNKLFKKDRYQDFIAQLGELFSDRVMSSNEVYRYLDFVEETHIDPQALLMISKYCLDYKKLNNPTSYILTVAREWVAEGCTSVEETEKHIREVEEGGEALRAVFRALKKSAAPDIGDHNLYIKWTKAWGFGQDAILLASKGVKRGGMERLDAVLDAYFREGVFSPAEIEDYTRRHQETVSLAYRINKALGLYYESVEQVVETYTAPWLKLGYSEDALLLIAKYCMMRSIRTLAGMDNTVRSLYKEGVVDEDVVKRYLDNFARSDRAISAILSAAGIARQVTEGDRELYRTWSGTWGLDDSLILYAAGLCQGRPYALSSMSNKLAKWREMGVTSPEQARKLEQTDDTAVPSTPRISQEAGAEFRKAEIRSALGQDATYRKLDQAVRTLKMQLARYELDGQPVPVTVSREIESLEAQMADRMRELGYDPKELE